MCIESLVFLGVSALDDKLIANYLLSVNNSDTPKIYKDKQQYILIFSENSEKIKLNESKVHLVKFGGLRLKISGKTDLNVRLDYLGIKQDTLSIKVQNIPVESIEQYPVLINGQSNERSNSSSGNSLNNWLEQIGFEKKSDRLIAEIPSNKSKSSSDSNYSLDFEAQYSSSTKSTRTRLTLRLIQYGSEQKKPIVISHYPFSVSKISNYSIDSDTDDIVAQWDSEESTGLWMFPVSSLQLTLPPQGIAQEMERGSRFWSKDGTEPTIESDKPIKTRFCGLTELTLSHKDLSTKRYVLPPYATEHWLSSSKIQKLSFEAVYPLQVCYEKAKASQTSFEIDEIGNNILAPAIPWDPIQNNENIMTNLNLSKWLSPGLVTYASDEENKSNWNKWLIDYKFRRLAHIGVGISLQKRVAEYNIINEGQPKKTLNLSGEELTAKLVPPTVDKEYYKDILQIKDGEPNPRKTAYPIGNFNSPSNSEFFDADSKQHIGLLGLFEFKSELDAVLRKLNATSLTTRIDYLILSSMGAATQLEASFDEGRTSFHTEVVDAHSVKLIKTRIGRIACIKNKAKHVVEYIVSVCPSSQFALEQGEDENLKSTPIKYLKLGWPIIRKSEEYIQIEEQRREFSKEQSLKLSQSAIIKASYFPSNKIYVNSAWGEELDNGYKIPLFKENDPSGFYVKPIYALVCYGKDGEDANHYHEQPHCAYFYTNTQEGKGADSDLWDHLLGIDYRSDFYTPPLYESINPFRNPVKPDENITPIVTPALDTSWQSDPKFDWLVRSESPCNLVHGRDGANEPLLANVSVISIDRREAKKIKLNALKNEHVDVYNRLVPESANNDDSVSLPLQQAAELRTLEALISRLPSELEKIINGFANPSNVGECEKIKNNCIKKINQYFKEGKDRLEKIDLKVTLEQKVLVDTLIDKQFGVIQNELNVAIVFADKSKASFDVAISELMKVTDQDSLQNKLKQLCDTELLIFIDKSINRIDYHANEAFVKIDTGLKALETLCTKLDDEINVVIAGLKSIINFIDQLKLEDFDKQFETIKTDILTLIDKIEEANKKLSSIEKQILELIPKSSGYIKNILSTLLISIRFLASATNSLPSRKTVEDILVQIKKDLNSITALPTKIAELKSKLEFLTTPILNLKSLNLKSVLDDMSKVVNADLKSDIDKIKIFISDTLWSVFELPKDKKNSLVDYLAYLSQNKPSINEFTKFNNNFNNLHSQISANLISTKQKLESLKIDFKTNIENLINSVNTHLGEVQSNFKESTLDKWSLLREKLVNEIDGNIDCGNIQSVIDRIKKEYINPAEKWLKENVNDGLAKIIDQRALERYKTLQRKIESEFKEYKAQFESKQSAVLTLSEMITHPPQLPNLNLSSQSLAMAFAGDASGIIDTAPFIARIDAAKGALSALGIDTKHNAITDTFDAIGAEMENKLSNCLKKLGGLDGLFSKFDDVLNSKEFKIVNITSDGRVSLKPELQKFIPGERPILESGVFAIALNNTYLNVVTDIETEIITAKVRANWALKFNGQALVVFENVQLTYSSNGDYQFDLNPQNVRLHPSLKFISDLMSAVEESLPPGVEFEKGSQGQITGVKASLVQQFPGFSIAAATIGPFAIQSDFGLRFASGAMELVAGFGLGTQNAPVYIQFGVYGGGGWVGANVLYNPNNPIIYQGFMGVAVGSMSQFNIAGIARGSYAILIFAYANFDVRNTYLEAGLLVNGSARVLGYINASLSLKLSVEYNGSKAHGKGEIDLEIDICWCYSVHIHSAVDQDF